MQYTYNQREDPQDSRYVAATPSKRVGDPPEINGTGGFELNQARMEMGIAIVKSNEDSESSSEEDKDA